jgi:hypothetical protein
MLARPIEMECLETCDICKQKYNPLYAVGCTSHMQHLALRKRAIVEAHYVHLWEMPESVAYIDKWIQAQENKEAFANKRKARVVAEWNTGNNNEVIVEWESSSED